MPEGYGYRDRSPQVWPFRGNSGAAERNPPQRHGTNTTRQFGVNPYYLEPDDIDVDTYAPPTTERGLYGTVPNHPEPYYEYGDWNPFGARLPPRRQTYGYRRRFRSPSHPVKPGISGRRMRYQGATSRYSSDSRDSSVDYATQRTKLSLHYGNGNRDGRRPELLDDDVRQMQAASGLAARGRERYLKPTKYHAASDEEGEFEDLPEDKVFSFAPMQASMLSPEAELFTNAGPGFRVMEGGGQLPSVAMINFMEKERDVINGVSTSLAGKLLNVINSQYMGEDAYYDGNHSVRLTVARDPKHSREPLFRWLHLHQKQLNLDELSAEISKVPSLSDEERHGFTKLLGQVRTNVKYYRTANGRTVKHMKPGTIRVTIVGNHASGDQAPSDKSRKRSLTWLCIPYFTLEKYSGLMSSQTAASFPPETLLQYDYAASAQERDMEQVITLAGVVSGGQCIHVNQLWSIVLDDSLLITCGRMPSLTDQNGAIKTIDGPPPEMSFRTRSIHVSYYRTVLWALPLDECSTWFSFVKHFHEFWPQAVRFYHRNRTVTETDWPQIVHWARNSLVTVELRMSSHPQPPPKGILQHYEKVGDQARGNCAGASELPNPLPESVNDIFHVFTWMDIARPSSESSTDLNLDNIVQQLREADNYLAKSTSKRARKTYDAGRLSTHEKLHAHLETTGQSFEGVGDDEDSMKRDEWASCVDLYNAAEIVFRFFLPWRFDGGAPTIGKFWGAVEGLVKTVLETEFEENERMRRRLMPTASYSYRRSIVHIAASLRDMIGSIQSFQSIFSHLSSIERAKIEVPDSLVCAWLHLVLALVQGAEDGANWRENLGIADALITKGMAEVMNSLSASSLLQAAAIQPVELLTLINQGLLQDSLGIDQSLNDTYYQYMKKLEIEINDNPDRSNQYRINQLKKELEIVQRVIRVQHGVISGILPPLPILEAVGGQSRTEARILEEKIDEYEREKSRIQTKTTQMKSPGYYEREASYPLYRDTALLSSNRDPEEFSKLSPIDPGGFAEFFVRECVSLLERRGNDIQDFLVEASRLETYNMTNIDITKDKQEKAVYAFTMVTIIFLPLGTISSIFGMNTSDIANMEMSQWIYWVVALPVTLLVIIGGLWWMGELQDLVSWFFRWNLTNRKPRNSRNNAKYSVAMASQVQNPFAPPEALYAVQPSPPPPPPPPPLAASIYTLPSRRRTGYTSRPRRQ